MATFNTMAINSGFLLTRQVQDKGLGLQITLWLKSSFGPIKLQIDNELAVFFVKQEQLSLARQILLSQNIALEKYQLLALKTFKQEKVAGLYFSSLRLFYRARDVLKKQNIKCYEDDIRPDDRFLMERHITANIAYIGEKYEDPMSMKHIDYNGSNGYQCIKQGKCKRNYSTDDVELTMLSIDIECSMEGELYSIGLYANNNEEYKRVLMIGDVQLHAEHYIDWQVDERQLLTRFIETVQKFDPDILIGWNVINFDFSLLQQRCDLLGVKFCIGRDGSTPYWRKNANNTEQSFIEIAGRVVLDGIDLLKTATYSFSSFSLDNVAHNLLGMGKKVTDVENRIQEITDNFNHNKSALAAYNLEDCRLVWLIFEKTQLLDFAKLRAQLTGLAIDRVGGSVAAFTNLYLPKLHRSGYVAPNMGDGESGLISPGGYVMDSIPGLYTNVLVLDFKSLYPSIIRTFKIDPMGLIEGLRTVESQAFAPQNNTDVSSDKIVIPFEDVYFNSVIKGFDGAFFSRDKHFLPDIIESLWSERDKAKQQDNAALSQAIKIIMNSFYGVLGSTGCRFYDPRLSGSITKRSHEILKKTSSWIELAGYKVIYGDTDSIFVSIGRDKSEQQAKNIGVELQALVNEKWGQTLKQDFNITSQLDIEFETHFTKFLMPTVRGSDVGTKKRYAGLVSDLHNKKAPCRLIFKGLESVRTDWTQLAKDFQKVLYLKVFNQEDVVDYVKDILERTLAGEFDDKLIYRKRIRRQLADYIKNVPPHVKAARLADNNNEKLGKPLRYQRRGWIQYYITLQGPQVIEQLSASLDYQFYIDSQLATVADAILPFIGTSFSQITDKQLGLF
jgi:DNA polymerase-2